MVTTTKLARLFVLCLALVLCASIAYSRTRRGSSKRTKRPAAAKPAPTEGESDESANTGEQTTQIRLRLTDGTLIPVDEAWESEQGIWYRVGGVTHLVTRDRVKTIERGQSQRPKVEPQVAKVTTANGDQAPPADQPVWIYLLGGARVEVDSATESSTGVWYRRGSLSLFIERSRIDHIEREALEKLADAKKERGWSTGNAKIDSSIRQSGAKFGVDPYLIFCVMEQESHFNSRAVSPKGARGLMQLMPGTGARFGVRHPFSPTENIAGGTRYLKQLLDKFNGRVDLVLASYNAGEGAVIKFGHRVPPYRETRNYVKRIGYRYRRGKAAPAGNASSLAAGGA
jgi:transglycosylase-like protein with SLT domain